MRFRVILSYGLVNYYLLITMIRVELSASKSLNRFRKPLIHIPAELSRSSRFPHIRHAALTKKNLGHVRENNFITNEKVKSKWRNLGVVAAISLFTLEKDVKQKQSKCSVSGVLGSEAGDVRGGDLHGSENYEGVKREDEITASAVDRFLSSTWRGNEKPMFSEDIEKVGCIKIMESLTDEEKISMPDVNMAIRYFRAEKGFVKKAVKKIKATLKWRKEWDVDATTSSFEEGGDLELRKMISQENETGKVYVRGYDRNGRAVVYFKPGKENMESGLNNLKHMVYHLERAAACTARKSDLSKMVMILDFDEYRLSKSPPLSISKMTVSILQNHYPERLHKFYICNPPFIFRSFWNIISPFVDPVTKNKVVFCNGDRGAKVLENDFVRSTLEVGVGGTGVNLRPFDSQEYLTGPYAYTFDEKSG